MPPAVWLGGIFVSLVAQSSAENAETVNMRHVNEARKLYEAGDGNGALHVLENLLDLAPRNPEALRIKAKILDSWGRFEESYQTLVALSQVPNPTEEIVHEIEQRATEEREAVLFSELTSEGRWYYALPGSQIWVSVIGLIGCLIFLVSNTQVNFANPNDVMAMALSFFFLVLLPSILLVVIQLTGVKRILVGLSGLRVCTRFREQNFQWEDLKAAVVEFDPDPRVDFLRLKLYGRQEGSKTPLVSLDISRANCVVRARRHFLKNVVTHVDTVCYVSRFQSNGGIESQSASDVDVQPPTALPPKAG